MDKIGDLLPGKNLAVTPESRRASAEVEATRLWMRRTREPMPAQNLDVDFRMPRQLWSAWKEDGKDRQLRRALTADERRLLELRRSEVAPWVAGFHERERDEVVASLAEMLTSFPSTASRNDAQAAGHLEALAGKLGQYPRWAIDRVCERVGLRGYTKRDEHGNYRQERHWAPSDPELVEMIEQEVAILRRADASAAALLGAEVEP